MVGGLARPQSWQWEPAELGCRNCGCVDVVDALLLLLVTSTPTVAVAAAHLSTNLYSKAMRSDMLTVCRVTTTMYYAYI